MKKINILAVTALSLLLFISSAIAGETPIGGYTDPPPCNLSQTCVPNCPEGQTCTESSQSNPLTIVLDQILNMITGN